jgi:hypothetical protein
MSPVAEIDFPHPVPNRRKAILHAFEGYISVLGIDRVIREVIHPDDVANLLGRFPLPKISRLIKTPERPVVCSARRIDETLKVSLRNVVVLSIARRLGHPFILRRSN